MECVQATGECQSAVSSSVPEPLGCVRMPLECFEPSYSVPKCQMFRSVLEPLGGLGGGGGGTGRGGVVKVPQKDRVM